MKQRKQPLKKLTSRFGSHNIGKHITVGLLISVTLATGLFVFTVGSLTEPGFWHPVQLVDHMANLIIFSAVSLIFLAQIGYSFHLFLAAVDAAVHLMVEQIGQSLTVWLTAVFIELRLTLVRYLPGKRIPEAALKNQVHAILTAIQRRLNSQRPKTKAPILLFQQAPLLVAP